MPRPPSNLIPLIARSDGEVSFRPTGAPLAELYAKYLGYGAVQCAPKTRKNHEWTRKLCAGMPPHPSVDEVLRWHAQLPGAPSTVHAHVWNLQRVYSWGGMAGLVAGNPVALCRFKAPEIQPRAIRNVARAWPQILACARNDRERAFLAALRFAGVRLGEALALEPTDVIEGGRWLSITKQREANSWATFDLKGGLKSHHTIPVRPELRSLLVRALGLGSARVMVGRGGQREVEVTFVFPFRSTHLQRLRASLKRELPLHFGVGDAFHVLRHSLAAELGDAGRDTTQVQKVLGHASSATTDHYMSALVGKRVDKEVFAGLDPPRKKRGRACANTPDPKPRK